MAKQIITTIIDDLDGGEADETVIFGLDGNAFEIDLSVKNAKRLRDFLEPFMSAGSRTGRFGTGGPQLQRHHHQPNPTVLTKQQNTLIREWAANNDFEVSDRGRIPLHIVEAYQARLSAQNVVAAVKKAAGSKEVSFKKPVRA